MTSRWRLWREVSLEASGVLEGEERWAVCVIKTNGAAAFKAQRIGAQSGDRTTAVGSAHVRGVVHKVEREVSEVKDSAHAVI